MNIKPRFILYMAVTLMASSVVLWAAVVNLSHTLVSDWGGRYLKSMSLYDRERTLQPIFREISLVTQLINNPLIQDWSVNPSDEALKPKALATLEAYRRTFQDASYFFAIVEDGAYYHNNAANEYIDNPLRYTLAANNPGDAWFYNMLNQQEQISLNVDRDRVLDVVKLWINMQVKKDGKVVAVGGTGLDLSSFLNAVLDNKEPGIATLFTDKDGAIQLAKDESIIDFASFTKNTKDKTLVFDIFHTEDARKSMREALDGAKSDSGGVEIFYSNSEAGSQLVGVVYIPELDWYEITLVDLETVLPFSLFGQFVSIVVLMFVAALLVLYYALARHVTTPIELLKNAIGELRQGRTASLSMRGVTGDVSVLFRHFKDMASALIEHQRQLEHKVEERTRELERISYLDALTGLQNRRGLERDVTAFINRWRREQKPFGVIWVDVDHFKQINDTYGHHVGDIALQKIADHIRAVLRDYDRAARWGGDEFLIVLDSSDKHVMQIVGDRLLDAGDALSLSEETGDDLSVKISVGGCIIQPGDTLDSLLRRADEALYRAKAQRDGVFQHG